MTLICGITIVGLLLIIALLSMELARLKMNLPIRDKESKQQWKDGWEARKWYDRGSNQQKAASGKAA